MWLDLGVYEGEILEDGEVSGFGGAEEGGGWGLGGDYGVRVSEYARLLGR